MQSRVISFLNVWWYLEVELQPHKQTCDSGFYLSQSVTGCGGGLKGG